MGYLGTGILILTLVCLFFGFIFGLARGIKRSILRLILILACIVIAYLVKGAVYPAISSIKIEGVTLIEYLTTLIPDLPTSFITILESLISIIIGLITFILVFLVLQFITWLIIYPFLKLIFHPGEKRQKEEKGRVKKYRFFGGLVGIVQGIVCAFALCVPLTGLAININTVASTEITDGTEKKVLLELPEEIGISSYTDSALCSIYDGCGGWFYSGLTTVVAEDGTKTSLTGATEAVSAAVELSNELTNLSNTLNETDFSEGITTENAPKLEEVFNKLDEVVNTMSPEALEFANNTIQSVIEIFDQQSEIKLTEVIPDINNFEIQDMDFGSIGKAVVEIANISEEQKQAEGAPVEIKEESVTIIVEALAKNEVIVNAVKNAIPEGTTFLPEDVEKEKFENAIEKADITPEQAQIIRELLGINS